MTPSITETQLAFQTGRDTGPGTTVGDAILEQASVAHYGQEEGMAADEPKRRLPCNVGRTEQKIRLIGGSAMLAAAAFAPLPRGWRIALGGLGGMELLTGSTRYCPLWQALGVSTAKGDER